MNYIYFSFLIGSHLFAADPTNSIDPFDAFPIEQSPDIVQENRFLGEFLYMLLMLGMLITIVILAGYFLRRLTSSRIEALNTSSRIKIQERRALSQRAQVHLIEIDEKEYLIAESATAISIIPIQNACRDQEKTI